MRCGWRAMVSVYPPIEVFSRLSLDASAAGLIGGFVADRL
jgi:hypothetical protein